MSSEQSVQSLLALADQLYRMGDFAAAENSYRQVLSVNSKNPEALLMMGVISVSAQNYEAAENFLNNALLIKSPYLPMCHKVMGDICRMKGRYEDSAKHYKEAAKLKPDFVEASANLASLYLSLNKLDEAAFFNKKVLGIKPDYAPAIFNMGLIHEIKKDYDRAQDFYNKALAINPRLAPAFLGLGRMAKNKGQYDEAASFLEKSIAINPMAESCGHLAEIYQDRGDLDRALTLYDAAVQMAPRNVEYLNNLGALYSKKEEFRKASEYYQRVLEITPDNPATLNNMASSLKAFSQMDAAIEMHKRSLIVRPGHAKTYTNLLLAMVYSSNVTAQEIFYVASEFGRTVADPLLKFTRFDNLKDKDRKLRIGYVSPDFRAHSVNYFFEPLLDNHDRKEFEIFAYSNVEKEDGVTQRLRQKFDHWCDIQDVEDDKVADIIHADGIDILIDLAGHTGRNSLLAFARKPAPVQATWLGFPATTGVKAIDYRITDIHTEPPGMTEQLSVEKLWRLPEIFCCYGAADHAPAVIDHPPFEDNGFVTFGCFNNFSKVTDDVLDTWSIILARVPTARLMLEIGGLDQFRKDLEERLQGRRLPLDRVILIHRRPENQYHLYNRIDIALDPFPCNGGTTSMDTIWMGVPFVTLAGDNFVSRMGVTILTNVGMPELICHTREEYIEKAVSLANDHDGIKRLREGLRERAKLTPLMNQPLFARRMEEAYRQMWALWCDS